MRYHLNGFRSGAPPALEHGGPDGAAGRTGGDVDVLIVGSGPTGLTLAAQLAAFPEITTRIVEQKPGPLQMGQADGIACRTMEMFEAFGFAERVTREAYWVNETSFWKPDDAQPGHIVRSRVIQDVEDGLSEFPHVILNQARVHDFYLDVMRDAPAPLVPDYGRRLVALTVDASAAYPVTAELESGGSSETVRARFVVGCDGARSAVRQLMGRTLDGGSASQAWGVMDVLCVTDFPDIRRKAAIHSADQGSILIIPREGGYLVRLYIELDKLAENQRVANLEVTSEQLVAAARRILAPYTLDVKEIAWWSVYEIGQRLCERFDDATDNPRIFIAGDACHTHSPKAGQGMNVSMQDAFNIGWKLASVLRGTCSPAILATYSEERHAIAKELIDFDQEFARMFSARPKGSAGDAGIDPVEFQDYFVRAGRFTAGTATHYRRSLITGTGEHQSLARGFTIGMRFHSAPVIRMADGKPMHLGHTARADGRWRLFVFADGAIETGSRAWTLCERLEQSDDSPLRRYGRPGDDVDSTIEVIAIPQAPHTALSVAAMPPLLVPKKGRYGLVDYEKVFCPDIKSGTDIFDMRGIDRQQGCMVVVRPDQYVAHVLPLDAYAELVAFFEAFMQARASFRDRRDHAVAGRS